MTNTLSGLNILVTRPLAQAQTWAEQLRQLGAEVTLRPVMVIAPVEDADKKQTITKHILDLDHYQKAIFISQNAAQYGSEWIENYWPQLPVDLGFFAVGQATRASLLNHLNHLGLTIASPQVAMNSEGLLALKALSDLTGEKVLIFRGVGGRDFLGKEIEKRGGQADYLELYYRNRPEGLESIGHLAKSLLKTVTVVHSGESLNNLCALLKKDDLQWVKKQPILVPGERVAKLAQELAFTTIIQAINATHQSMTEALYDWRQQHYPA